MVSRRTLPLFRCDRCGLTLYGPPNGIKQGDRCHSPTVAEWHRYAGLLMSECWGTFELAGTLTLVRSA